MLGLFCYLGFSELHIYPRHIILSSRSTQWGLLY